MVGRRGLSAGVSGAGWIRFALVATVLAGPAAAQDLVIDGDRTTPISTTEANPDATVDVSASGNVTINQTGPVVTVESDNDVTVRNGGGLTNEAASDAVGVYFDLNEDRNSSLFLEGDLLVGETAVDAEIGSNNVGVLVGTADQTGVLDGDITLGSLSFFVISGNDSVGVELNRQLAGSITLDGAMTITGESAMGVVSRDVIQGIASFRGTVVTRGTASPSATGLDVLSGPSVAIGASILNNDVVIGDTMHQGGMYVRGPIEFLDGTFTSQIRSIGGAPALYISPQFAAGDPQDIVFGIYDQLGDADPTLVDVNVDPEADPILVPVYSFLNRGTIQSEGVEPGRDTTGVIIEGFDGHTVTFEGGIFNQGVIAGIATSANTAATDVAADIATNARGLVIGNGATIPTLVNQGSITATTSGPAGGMAVGLLIDEGASLPSIVNRVAINGRNLPTETDVEGVIAYGIRDKSDTLTSITNQGTIEAVVSETDAGSIPVAIDVSTNTNSLVIDDTNTEDGTRAGIINGEIRFGQGDANLLNIEGRVTDGDGNITSRAQFAGSISIADGGMADVNVFDGTFQATETTVTNIVAGRAAGDVDFDADDLPTVRLILDDVPNVDPILSTTGTMTFYENAHIGFSSFSFLGDGGTYALLNAGGGITFMDQAATLNYDAPFLYHSEFVLSDDNQALGLTLQRKTAAELDLTGNLAAIYEPAVTVAADDDVFGRGLISITDEAGVKESLASLVPNVGLGARALTISVTDAITGPIGQRQRELLAAPAQGVRFWGQEFYEDQNAGTSVASPSYFGSGTGVSVGLDWGRTNARYGVSYTYFAGQVTESIPRATKENIALNLITAYANWRANNFFIQPQLSGGYSSYDNRRRVIAGPIVRRAIADWNAFLATGGITTGYIFDFEGIQIIPHVSINGLYMTESGYTERFGGDAVNLELGRRDTRSVRVFAGIAAQAEFMLEDGVMRPQVLAGWSHEIIDDRKTIDASFEALPGSDFSIVGPVSDKSKLIGGAGFSYLFENWSAAFNVDASHSSGEFSQSASITMSSRF